MKELGKISRRNLLQGAGALAAAGAMGAAKALAADQLPAPTLPGSGGKPRALALIGDRYNNQNTTRVALDRIFQEMGISIDYTTNYYDLSAKLLKPYQLFICLRDNMIWPGGYSQDSETERNISSHENPGQYPPEKAEFWITEEQGGAVKDFVAAGNGFYSLQNNASVSRSSKNYRDVQGGLDLGHPITRPFQVRVVNKNHPVTEGVGDFMVEDWQHYLIYDKDPKGVLLESVNLDGLTFRAGNPDDPQSPPKDLGTTTVSGWAHEHGTGRVVFTAMGHTAEALAQPEYVKMQKNAVRWLLKMS